MYRLDKYWLMDDVYNFRIMPYIISNINKALLVSRKSHKLILFRPTAVVAMLTTVLAVIVVVIQLIIQAPDFKTSVYSDYSFRSFFLGFGTILFSFGGAATFPTIQNDMKDRTKFPYSVVIAFAGKRTTFNMDNESKL